MEQHSRQRVAVPGWSRRHRIRGAARGPFAFRSTPKRFDTNTTYIHFKDDKASGGSPQSAWMDTPGGHAIGPGLRAIVRNVDIGFGYGASEIEEYARKEAREQGDKSLPSIDIDIPAGKELDAETFIRECSKKVFSDWLRILRERIGDAILAACNNAGEKMELLKNAVHELEQTLAHIAQLEAPSSPPNGGEQSSLHARYERLMKHWFYLVVIGMLIVVDWVANVPVFRSGSSICAGGISCFV